MGTRTYEHIPLVTFSYTHTGQINASSTSTVNLALVSGLTGYSGIPHRLRRSLKGTIVGLRAYLNQATKVDTGIRFFANDNFISALAVTKMVGEEDIQDTDYGTHGGGTLGIADIGGIAIPYVDEDESGEFHFSITNEDGAQNIGANTFKLEWDWRPFYPA